MPLHAAPAGGLDTQQLKSVSRYIGQIIGNELLTNVGAVASADTGGRITQAQQRALIVNSARQQE